jgi:ABC-type uncharacterized transport system permease subunit
MFNTVIEIYLGILNGPDLFWALLNQLFWILFLFLLASLVLKVGIRRLVVLGG